MSTTPYVTIPLVIFESRDNGVLTPEQFDVFAYCYWRAERPEYIVRGYSAENVCRFRGIDATRANLKRYQRAAAELLKLNLLSRDYYHVDASRPNHYPRPYNVWVPNPARFDVIGTAAANRVSLFVSPNVAKNVADNVALPFTANDGKDDTSENSECDNVAKSVALNHHILSITNQENPKTIEKGPLNPQGGLLLPPPPSRGEHSDAVGLSKPFTGRKKPLNPEQCDQLQNAALLYADFSYWLCGFVPNVDDVASLLRDFKPIELLFAQVDDFPPGEHVPKKTMAHFFKIGAKTLIEAARLKGTATSQPHWPSHVTDEGYEEVIRRWKIVQDAWRDISISPKDGGQPDDYLESLRRVGNRKQVVKQFFELVGRDERVRFDKANSLNRAYGVIADAIQKAEDDLGESIQWSVLSAIVKHRIAVCSGDAELLANFGKNFIANLVSDIRAFGLTHTAPAAKGMFGAQESPASVVEQTGAAS